MIVYIQALHQFPIADWGVAALLGFKQLGARIKFYESIEEVPVNRDLLLIGFAEDTMRWFNAMGIRPPYIPTLPPILDYITGRLVQRTTLAESPAHASYPFFIKPYAHHKQFDARLIEKATDIQALQRQFAQEVPVLISEPVVFLAEYRAFCGELITTLHALAITDYPEHVLSVACTIPVAQGLEVLLSTPTFQYTLVLPDDDHKPDLSKCIAQVIRVY